jgi:hypothetical protein
LLFAFVMFLSICITAVWDLAQIRDAAGHFFPCGRSFVSKNRLYSNIMFKDRHNNHLFDETDDAFEHIFSSFGYVAGLSAAWLPAVTFHHIGDVSAYILNNFTRPWEGTVY